MVEDYTKEEFHRLVTECQKKYEKLEKETVMKALTGEIGTNSAMVEELEILNIHYHDEMDEYDLAALDLNPGLIENFKRASVCARRCSTRRCGSTKMVTCVTKTETDYLPTENIVYLRSLNAENEFLHN